MTIARTKPSANELDALAQTLRPSWELLFGNGAPQDFIPPPTPPTRRIAEAQPERLPTAEPRVRRQDSLSARTPAQKSFPEPAVSVPTTQTPWAKIAILAAVAVIAGGIAIMLTRGGDGEPSTNEVPAETKAPAAEEKEPPPPETKVEEPTPPVEEKASEPPEPPPVAAPPPEAPKPAAPKLPPAPKAPAPKAPAPKAPAPGPKPQPKGDGIVREVPF